jgi:hypothetical protein
LVNDSDSMAAGGVTKGPYVPLAAPEAGRAGVLKEGFFS